jgi:hypothetical protein
MPVSTSFVDYVREQLAGLGEASSGRASVRARRTVVTKRQRGKQ